MKRKMSETGASYPLEEKVEQEKRRRKTTKLKPKYEKGITKGKSDNVLNFDQTRTENAN